MAGATALQAIAIETPPDALQVVNFHPGPNFTQAAKDSGYSLDDDIPWQDSESNPPLLLSPFLLFGFHPNPGFTSHT